MARRFAAGAALLALIAAPIVAIAFAFAHLGLLVVTVVAAVAIGASGWIAVTNTGFRRAAAAAVVVLAVAAIAVGFFIVLPATGAVRDLAVVVLVALFGLTAARYALRGTDDQPPQIVLASRTGRARHPVVFMNPKSGGGKVGRFDLVNEARRRGIEAVLLDRNDDLRTLVLDALADGADALGVAGGDGSQAIVASIAIEHGVPFVCVPAGTRNHLALDLGVDRDDVVRALDAFAAGPERLVDVGLVGDRVFVNNVSFGVYGEVVESQSYRDAKLRTAAAQMPELLGPGGRAPELRFPGPDGAPRSTRELVLVSNNPYQFGARDGFGTRPRLDTGTLGVLSVRVDNARDAARFSALALAGRAWAFPGCETWTTTTFTLEADAAVAAGIDGESVRLEPPVRFRTRPHALRVWLAEDAPATCRRAEPVRLEPETMAHLWAEARGRP